MEYSFDSIDSSENQEIHFVQLNILLIQLIQVKIQEIHLVQLDILLIQLIQGKIQMIPGISGNYILYIYFIDK